MPSSFTFTLADIDLFEDTTGAPLTAGAGVFQDEPTPIVLGLIHFDQPNGLDTSDKDEMINIRHAPVFGMFMPDTIASFASGEQTFYITANEGDGDYDRLFVYGARSMTIWDQVGNLVFDSGNAIARWEPQGIWGRKG